MRAFFVLSLFAVTLTSHAAGAAESFTPDFSDVEVVAVAPRSPDLKPVVLVIFPEADKDKVLAARSKNPTVRRPAGEADR